MTTADTADLPPWDPRAGWDEVEEGRPAPDCAPGCGWRRPAGYPSTANPTATAT
jgi:hypothetical protein